VFEQRFWLGSSTTDSKFNASGEEKEEREGREMKKKKEEKTQQKKPQKNPVIELPK
jgi:hypothetical protein